MADRKEYSGEEVRQGEIIFRQRWQRVVFIGGLVAAVVLVVVFGFA